MTDAICEWLLQFMNGVEIGSCWHGRTGQSRLRFLSSFGSRDVFLVAFGEYANMLIAHEVSPAPFPHALKKVPKRAGLAACLRLAKVRFSRLPPVAIE